MRFWESMKIALGMEAKGKAPSFLTVDKVTLDGGPLKVEWKAASELTKDEVLVARMLHDIFIDKFVMHESMEREQVEAVLSSLNSLRSTIDGYVDGFTGSVGTLDCLLASMLLSLRSAGKIATNGIHNAKDKEAKGREAFRRFEVLESDDIITVRDTLPGILADFRYASYPPVALLVELLPENHLSRVRAEPLLVKTRIFLLERFATVPEPTWDIEF